MRKKISTTIYVTPEQADKLKLLHERTKVPVAVYIREGIDLVLRHYAHMLPGQLALVDERQLTGKQVSVVTEHQIDPLTDVHGHRHLRALVQELQLVSLLRRHVDGGRDLLAHR